MKWNGFRVKSWSYQQQSREIQRVELEPYKIII